MPVSHLREILTTGDAGTAEFYFRPGVYRPVADTTRRSRRLVSISESTVPGLVGLMDALVIIAVGLAFYFGYVGWHPENAQNYAAVIAIDVALTVGLLQNARLYEFDTIVGWPCGLRRIIMVCVSVFLVLVAMAFALKVSETFSRVWFFASFGVSMVTICVLRGLFKVAIRRWALSGTLVRNIAVVGAGDQAKTFLGMLCERDTPWKRIVGVFDDRHTRIGNDVEGVPILGDLDDLVRYVRSRQIDEVVIALPWNADQRLMDLAKRLEELPVHVYLGADLIGYHFPRRSGSMLQGIPVLEVARTPLSGWGGIVKRLEDILLAGFLALFFAPLMALVALAIKLDSPGPVLFRQARYGFNNQAIMVYKFRTMYHGRPPENGVPQASRRDRRVTRIGWFLRRTSLDELPQLFNVLKGSMSIVGPRPHAVEHNEQYAELIGGYFGRHKVKPGITGWAQVNGPRGETDQIEKMHARVQHDIYYIENWSLWFDLMILAMTSVVGFVHKQAY